MSGKDSGDSAFSIAFMMTLLILIIWFILHIFQIYKDVQKGNYSGYLRGFSYSYYTSDGERARLNSSLTSCNIVS